MPIKIYKCPNVSFDANNSTGIKAKTPLFKEETATNNFVQYKGKNIIKDAKFTPVQVITLKILEKANLIMINHPKFGRKILAIGEKILRNADCLKQNK